MELILSILQVFISVVLIFLVLLHSGKDSGLSGAFGIGQTGSSFGGGSLVERNLDRWTIFFAILSIIAGIILLFSPAWGAAVLWLILGIALIVLGLLNIIRAFRFGKNA